MLKTTMFILIAPSAKETCPMELLSITTAILKMRNAVS